jgi:hypothetical protein
MAPNAAGQRTRSREETMMRPKRGSLAAALLFVAAPAKSENIVITQFGAACAGNPFSDATYLPKDLQ